MSWQEFWNNDTPIYVNDRHKEVHYRMVATDLMALIDRESARVLDYGCGEALHADSVAEKCSSLVLTDAAPLVRSRLNARFAGRPCIEILAPDQVEALPASTFDVIIVNSVVQYLSLPEFERVLGAWHRLLDSEGRLILGDIIPRATSPIVDATALLRLAREHRFLTAAGMGLVRTFFSPYRSKRAQFGLLRFDELEFLELLRRYGFEAHRRARNIGHNSSRLTVIATPRPHRTTIEPPLSPRP